MPVQPQHRWKDAPEENNRRVAQQRDFRGRCLEKDRAYLEVGRGDWDLALEVARHVERVWAVDVSEEITHRESTPSNSSTPVTPTTPK